ncbi:hypothetical protein G6F24_016027 [Rhizopus arrhizus]|nr:hypothetical protein G6F24_016027 [Rhizopus arrhizus]
MLVLAAIDAPYQRWNWMRKLKMTRAHPPAAAADGQPPDDGSGPHRRRGGGQHLRLHRFGSDRVAGRDRRGDEPERQGHRHRLPGQAPGADPRGVPERAGGVRPAGLPERDGSGARSAAAQARSVRGPGARLWHQADPAPLRLPEDFRGLQPQVQLLHHPVDARQAGLAPGRRGAARSRAPGAWRRA